MASTPKIAALIVAAGRGTRAGGTVPKQWQPLCGKRVIDHTLAAFQRHPLVDRIIIVLNASDMAQAEGFTAQGCPACPDDGGLVHCMETVPVTVAV